MMILLKGFQIGAVLILLLCLIGYVEGKLTGGRCKECNGKIKHSGTDKLNNVDIEVYKCSRCGKEFK